MRVARGFPTFHDVVQLGIGADGVVPEQEARGDIRVIRYQAPNERKHRVRAMRCAKDNLIARVVQIECGCKRRLREIFDPAQRPHDAHAFRSLARAGRALKSAMPRDDHADACKMQEGGDCTDPPASMVGIVIESAITPIG